MDFIWKMLDYWDIRGFSVKDHLFWFIQRRRLLSCGQCRQHQTHCQPSSTAQQLRGRRWMQAASCSKPPLPGTCPGCALWPAWHTEQLQRYLNGQNLILEWKNSSIFRQTSQNNLNSKVKTNDTLKDQNLIMNLLMMCRKWKKRLVTHLYNW